MPGFFEFCGERGIRTPGPLKRTTVFKTAAFDHSAISPIKLYLTSAKTLLALPARRQESLFFRTLTGF